jgi:serine O-acetyltransferase
VIRDSRILIAEWYRGKLRGDYPLTFKEYKYLIWSDLYRWNGQMSMSLLISHLFQGESYKYSFWMRTCRFARSHPLLKYSLYPLAAIMLNHYRYKLGISIPYQTDISSGLYIGHFGGVVVHPLAKIGKNCNISQGVTIGQANRGKYKGYPCIGDNVFIGPGAKILGAVHIGNDVAIGANCVVTKDVPDNAVVAGVPGRVISFEGTTDYIIHTDYDDKLN